MCWEARTSQQTFETMSTMPTKPDSPLHVTDLHTPRLNPSKLLETLYGDAVCMDVLQDGKRQNEQRWVGALGTTAHSQPRFTPKTALPANSCREFDVSHTN
jgi:hypothetical protein